MTGPQPLNPLQRVWRRTGAVPLPGGVRAMMFRQLVNDGTLAAMVAEEPAGWHLSISFRSHVGQFTRYPTWDEIAEARYSLLPDAIDVVMHLPPRAEYVNLHPTTFHLHEHPARGGS